jgi:putative oxygen-independent coproporphyrinogen III oxidase
VAELPAEHPVRPDVPRDPLNGDGPGEAARDAARTGLYVHVPFCAVRCTYCHFSTESFSAAKVERWFAALEREAALRAPLAAGHAFTSLFFGGGTPSALSAKQFARLWGIVRAHFDLAPGAEVTLEANPESVKAPLLAAWREAGVNRLSLGVQSFERDELRRLGRMHDEARPAEAAALARAQGFERLSLDLMFGFPGHTLAAWERTLGRALDLGPEHLSAYAFIVEAGNPLSDAVLAGREAVADDDLQADLHARFLERAAEAGLRFYETSNVARPGAEARHNLTYWLRRDYLALGPSAHGLWRGERWGNRFATAAWAEAADRGEAPEESRETCTAGNVADEIVMLGLRLGRGLEQEAYSSKDWKLVETRFGDAFEAGEREGRLERTPAGWRIPPRHRFVADDVIAWLAARTSAVDSVSDAFLDSRPCSTPLSPAV